MPLTLRGKILKKIEDTGEYGYEAGGYGLERLCSGLRINLATARYHLGALVRQRKIELRDGRYYAVTT